MMKSKKLHFENPFQSYLKCLIFCVFSSASPFLFINFSLHFPFFWNLKNKRKNKKEEVGGVGREEGRNDNYLGKDITFFHIPFLEFKVKVKTETSDTVSKIKKIHFFPKWFAMLFLKETIIFWKLIACCMLFLLWNYLFHF